MKTGKKKKAPMFSNIASAIIPSVGIIAVPAAAPYFPEQKKRPREQWGPMAPTLIRAASASQLLIPSSSMDMPRQTNELRRVQTDTITGRMSGSTDGEDSDDESEDQMPRKTVYTSRVQNAASRPSGLSDAEKRMLNYGAEDDEYSSSITPKDPKEALTAELSRSSRKEERSARRTAVTGDRQVSPLALDPVLSQAGPTSARAAAKSDGFGGEARSVTTARSSLNESTTIPMSARSVSFKEPVVYETYDPPSSQSQYTNPILPGNANSVLDRLVIPPPQEYQHNYNELERRNQSLQVEVEQLRSSNLNHQKQYEQLLDRLQSSQNLSKQDLTDILRQSGQNQTRDLEGLNNTLKERCEQLQNELVAMRDRYAQSQNQSNIRELKDENNFLKDYIHRLNAASSDYQTMYPPTTLKKDLSKEQRRMQGLPMKGPSPIWLLNRKFLAPLFLYYDEKLRDREEFIRKIQTQLNDLRDQVKTITDENLLIHQRLSRSSTSTNDGGVPSDLEHIKRHAYLVLEENKVLQEQLNLQTDQLTNLQKTQIQEVSNLTRRLLLAENEKSETDRILETIRIRNEDLRRKYEQLMMDNNHKIHVQEHVHEIGEMKRLTDELSEKHAHEMQSLLRRVQESEASKKVAQLKLTDCRSDVERLKGEIKMLKKTNQKLQLRVQTFEKKLQLEQVKEQRLTTMLDNTTGEYEQIKLERDTYLTMAKTKEEEINQIRARLVNDAEKFVHLEERLENYKAKAKDRNTDIQDQTKKQYDNLKLKSLEQEQRIQQLLSLLNEKQVMVDELNSEKRRLQVDLETIWQATNADNMRMRERLLDMRPIS